MRIIFPPSRPWCCPPTGARPDVMNKCMSCLYDAGHVAFSPGMNHLDSHPPSSCTSPHCFHTVAERIRPGFPPELQPINSTPTPTPPFPQEEIDWSCVHKPLSNEVKAHRCHISLWPVRGRGMCNCIKGCVILKAHSISWTTRWCEPKEMSLALSYTFTDESQVLLKLLRKTLFWGCIKL